MIQYEDMIEFIELKKFCEENNLEFRGIRPYLSIIPYHYCCRIYVNGEDFTFRKSFPTQEEAERYAMSRTLEILKSDSIENKIRIDRLRINRN